MKIESPPRFKENLRNQKEGLRSEFWVRKLVTNGKILTLHSHVRRRHFRSKIRMRMF